MYKLNPDTGKQKYYSTDAFKSILSAIISILIGMVAVSYTHLTLPTNREV